MSSPTSYFELAAADAARFRDQVLKPWMRSSVTVRQALENSGQWLECGTETFGDADADMFSSGVLTITSRRTGETLREYPPQTWLEAVCYGGDDHIQYAILPGVKKDFHDVTKY